MSAELPVPHPTCEDRQGNKWYFWKDTLISPSIADLYSERKRLTDAELAAEFHSARADFAEASRHPSGTYWTPLDVTEDATAKMATKRATTFLRFATLPHYDEVAA